MGEYSLGDRIWFKKWPEQVPKSLDYPDCSLADFLHRTTSRYGANPAIVFLDTVITYDQLWDLVRRMAKGFYSLGLRKGDICAMMLPNSIQYVVAYYACQFLGVTVTAINPTYKAFEIQHQLKDSGARALVVLDAVFNEAEKALEGTKVRYLIGTNVVDLCAISSLKRFLGRILGKIPSGKLPSDAIRFMKLLNSDPDPPRPDIDPRNDVAVLQYTGGTTGLPKGAMLTHRNVVVNAVQCEAILWQHKPGMCFIGVLPLFHSYAMTTVMNTAIRVGGFQLLFPKPPEDFSDLFTAIEKYSPPEGSIMPGVALLFDKINNHPKVREYDLTSLMMAISGAGPLPLEVQNRFEELTGSIIIEGYGLSEATPVTHANPLDKDLRKVGSIGLPLPDTDVRIVDVETGTKVLAPLPFALSKTGGLTGEQALEADAYTGELIVKGPQVMKGYMNRPNETAVTIRNDWLYTGDIACMDAEGFTILRDRAKDMIKCKGYPVFPAEVEDLLHRHPAVLSAAVIGVPHDKTGEVGKAFVVLTPESRGKVSEKDILDWAKDKITEYKVPASIEFRDELPTTMVGKVLRRVLKEEEEAKRREMHKGKAI
ncbi:MAG: long-chain fatty acid--CoA ligase [Deltaproteobacteria bacterium]|nr:long-chain fatty acid--CoA ligase [Deltaproteobacteria bacterium]